MVILSFDEVVVRVKPSAVDRSPLNRRTGSSKTIPPTVSTSEQFRIPIPMMPLQDLRGQGSSAITLW
jgi:hypothetical protein